MSGQTSDTKSTKPPSRTELRNEQVRANLEPLEPGERPTAVTIAAVIAALLAIGNLLALAVGVETGSSDRPGGRTDLRSAAIIAAVVLAVAAYGMFRARYWAVLGFQTLLAFQIIVVTLTLIGTNEWLLAVVAVVLIALSGTLFWYLVRAMARIQMPTPPARLRTQEHADDA